MRAAIRVRHLSIRTERAYVDWVRRYVLFHRKRHPAEMGKAEVEAFLSRLAVDRRVSASTQAQALSALLFFYQHVLDVDLPWLDEVVRAKRSRRLPVVLTSAEEPKPGSEYIFGLRKLNSDRGVDPWLR